MPDPGAHSTAFRREGSMFPRTQTRRPRPAQHPAPTGSQGSLVIRPEGRAPRPARTSRRARSGRWRGAGAPAGPVRSLGAAGWRSYLSFADARAGLVWNRGEQSSLRSSFQNYSVLAAWGGADAWQSRRSFSRARLRFGRPPAAARRRPQRARWPSGGADSPAGRRWTRPLAREQAPPRDSATRRSGRPQLPPAARALPLGLCGSFRPGPGRQGGHGAPRPRPHQPGPSALQGGAGPGRHTHVPGADSPRPFGTSR